jgi:hypothetical protein
LETNFSLELGDVAIVLCNHCGKQMMSVCGFIKRNSNAYSVYFALLHTGHDEVVALLTISIGQWWDEDAFDQRSWLVLTVRPSEKQFDMRIEEPEQSRHSKWKPLGTALSRTEALRSPLRDEFFAVADYIVESDPTVKSYLNEQPLDISRGLKKQ